MKNFFLIICLSAFFINYSDAAAEMQQLTSLANPKNQMPQLQPIDSKPSGMPNPNDIEAVREFFKKRFEEAAVSEMSKDVDWNNAVGVNIIHTPEYYQAQEEQKKPLFQKMYEQTIKAFSNNKSETNDSEYDSNDALMQQDIANIATRFFTMQDNTQTIRQPQIPTIGITLPSGRKVLAPAREHIPYFLSYIDIQANGYLKIEDTIMVVANNNKFAYGLTRMFPKYATKNQRIDFVLESVTINDTKVPYTIEEIGNNIVLKPQFNQKLEPGIYTYRFQYMVNNKLIVNNNQINLDWSIVGRPMNAFITSANAIVTVPTGHSFDRALAIVGRGKAYTDRRTNIFSLAGNVLAFSNTTPLLNREDMHILADMNKNVFIKDFADNYSNFINNWGNILYSLLGLLAIFCSLFISLLFLKKEHKNNKYTPSYNGYLMRRIIVGKYDRIAFVAQILDLFRKKALDIEQDEQRIFLVKNNINNSRLNSSEKRALKILFANKITKFEINNANNVAIKKAKHIFEKFTNKQIKKHQLRHNIMYVIFSVIMLLLTEFFIAYISVNFAQSIIILLSTTLSYAFYIWILYHRFKKWYLSLPIKVFSLLALFVIWVFSSIYVGGITSFIIMLMVAIIFAFNRIFGEQNNFINEAKNSITTFKEYLISNADAINLSAAFINQQSNVFALDIVDYYPQNISNKNTYKLDIADNLKQTLIGII